MGLFLTIKMILKNKAQNKSNRIINLTQKNLNSNQVLNKFRYFYSNQLMRNLLILFSLER